MDTANLQSPDLYINRELSLLEFNERVLAQACDPTTPVLERLRFLCISSSNLDEFFEVRVAGLMQQAEFGASTAGPDGLTPAQSLGRISTRAHTLVADQYRVLNDEVLPALAEHGIRFLRRAEWTPEVANWCHTYFAEEVAPIASPIRLDPAHPFPRVQNKSLHFIVRLQGEDAFGGRGGMAVVQAPRPLARVIKLPGDGHDFVFLSSIIHAYMHELFPGMEIAGSHQFRVTRNSDLFVDPEAAEDLKRALEGELHGRSYGDEVRLEVDDTCPDELVHFLARTTKLRDESIYRVQGPVNLHRLMAIPDLIERPELKYPSFTPGLPADLRDSAKLFEEIGRRDVLLYHPFESFAPVVDFVREAAHDPDVLAIKQTLYRTGAESVMVESLLAAARTGKEVTVVVELRARFDEAANISLASRLQEAGAHVVYGVVGYKTHAKMALVVRRESGRLRRYVHLGTGNYHVRTARIYTDISLLSANEALGEDVHKVFMQLTSVGRVIDLNAIWAAPFTLRDKLIEHIEREAEIARAGGNGRIVARMNALVEPGIIQALYAASQDGVEIDLIVRGVCGLRPGVPGVSERIRVRSLVGRFLEHARVFCFERDGDPLVLCSSADWMNRNLFQRVEVCFPVLNPELSQRVRRETLDVYLDDNTQAWTLRADGGYTRIEQDGEPARSAQDELLARLAR